MNPKDFVQWHRRIRKVISRDEPLFFAFRMAQTRTRMDSTSRFRQMLNGNQQSYSLGDAALAKTRELVNGNGTGKELWDKLSEIYTMSSTQAIAKLHAKMEAISFKDGETRRNHVSTIMNIIN